MKNYLLTIQSKKQEVVDTFIFRCIFQKKEKVPKFLPGQYVFLANPTYGDPEELHPFSVASSPFQQNYLEFCIKVYGQWTQALAKKEVGDRLYISGYNGSFIWDPDVTDAVFLLGGIGISPIMSMLRYLAESNEKKLTSITLLYGNRTPETIAYKKELEELQKKIPNFTIVHIFSHLSENHEWNGHRGFISRKIIEEEVNLAKKPTFFMIGPPIFLKKMQVLLKDLAIDTDKIKTESLNFQTSMTFPHTKDSYN